MHKTSYTFVLALASLGGAAQAAITLSPLASFGTDGVITASAGSPYLLPSGDSERSIAYNPITGNIYVAYRSGGVPNIQILNGTTGASSGTLMASGVLNGGSQGFRINCIDVGDDGQIYVDNVVTNANTTPGSGFNNAERVWRYSSEAAGMISNPTLIFSDQIAVGERWGDSFTVRGAGQNTQFLIGAGATVPPAGDPTETVALLNYTDSTMTALSAVPSDIGNPGDYRSGVAFGTGNSFYGKCGPQQATIAPVNLAYAIFDSGTGAATQADSFSLGATALSMSAIDVDNTDHLLAGLVGNQGAGDPAEVLLYDISDPQSPQFLTSMSLVNTNANQFQVGDVEFGSNGVLYILNTNNSIEAFQIQGVPEPALMGILGLAELAILRRRK